MDEDRRKRILESVRNASRSNPLKFEKTASVQAGQVRRLRAYDDDLESTLVLVLEVDEEGGFARVIGVVSPSEEATVRDLVVDRASVGTPFDLVLRLDGVSTAWTVQLSETPVVCSLPRSIVDLACRGPRLSAEVLAEYAEAAELSTGTLVPQTGDDLWWAIGRAAEHLARLTASCHEALVKPAVVDPAILPSLLSGEDKADWAEALAVIDAASEEGAELPPEAWDSFEQVLAQASPHDQDSWRLLQNRLLEAALRCPAAAPPSNSSQIAERILAPERPIATGLTEDPLKRLVARFAREGEGSTRIVTISRLWREERSVFHTTVGGQRHAIRAEVNVFEEVHA